MRQEIKYKKNKYGQIIAAYHYLVDDNGKGILHNESGPAVIEYNGLGGVTHEYWFINGKRITNTEMFSIKEKMHQQKWIPSDRLKNE